MAIESKMYRPPAFGAKPEDGGGGKKRPWVSVIAVILVVAGLVGGWYWWKSRPSSNDVLNGLQQGESGKASVRSGEFQAVFLDNGQTYFGRIDSRKGEFYRLTDVYYLDLRQNPQDTSIPASELKLVKLGGEVHGPDNYMDINKEHILFIEDLTPQSKVAQAIADYVSKKSQ